MFILLAYFYLEVDTKYKENQWKAFHHYLITVNQNVKSSRTQKINSLVFKLISKKFIFDVFKKK